MTRKTINFDEAREFIAASSRSTSVYLGCDSRRYRKAGIWQADYARVICVHKDSCHGSHLFTDIITEKDYGNLRQRLIREVEHTLDVWKEVWQSLDGRYLEFHVDVNTDVNAKSNVVLAQARGYVLSQTGLEPVFKPGALAASFAADAAVNKTLVMH